MNDQTPWHAFDVLSPPVRVAAETNAASAYMKLVARNAGELPIKVMLAALNPRSLFSGQVRNADDARAALAGLWLWHDWLDESHTISQAIATPTGSFWHAIMHRREGDFSNAKYWYARCRHHPVLEEIAGQARQMVATAAAAEPLHRLTDNGWDPDAFVDVVEAVHRMPDDPLHGTAVHLQRLEWRALFEHCIRQALGTS